MFDGLVGGGVALAVRGHESEITELRLRVGRPLAYATIKGAQRAVLPSGLPYIVRAEDIKLILSAASDFSYYAVNDDLVKGYLARRGVRIGVAGEGVSEDGKLLTMKNVSSLVIRIPHEIKGAADRLLPVVSLGGRPRSTLIISPPSGGKTTILRDLARRLSTRFNTLIIDERYEIAAAENGVPTLDVGDSEVVSGVAKSVAYENTVRAMSPEIIVTDEIFGQQEICAIRDIRRSGVEVFASVHGSGRDSILATESFAQLLSLFDVVVTLGRNPVGTIKEIISNG